MMKRFLILLALLAAPATLSAQISIKERAETISERFGVDFIYDSSLPVDKPYEGPLELAPALENNLDALVQGSGMAWSRRRGYIVLKMAAARRYTIKGFVTDAVSSESVIAAGVVSGKEGTVSNEFGFYSLSLREGRHELVYSAIGYAARTVSLNLDRDTVINISLKSDAVLSAAVISARSESGIHPTRGGSIELPIGIIGSTPAIGSEPDILKTLQLLPGVQGGYDGFSGIYVRGGGEDENLMLLDGIPVYNASHMFGIFSVFSPEAVKKVTLYKSDFPARYGGRTSSIVDVRTADGDMHKTHGSVTVGLLADKLHLEGPIVDGKTSYSVSGRVLHTFLMGPVLKALETPKNYWFYDLNGKLNHRFSDRDRLYFGFYNGRDFFKNDDYQHASDYRSDFYMRTQWGNTLTSLRWNHLFGDRIFANFTLATNNYRSRVNTNYIFEDYDYKSKTSVKDYMGTGLDDYSAKADFDWHPVPAHTVRFGGAYTRHIFKPQTSMTEVREDDSETQDVSRDTLSTGKLSSVLPCNEISFYAEDDIRVGDRLRLNPGLHLAIFNVQGRTYVSAQPRLSAKFEAMEGLAFKAGYSRMAQYIHLLCSGIVGLPTDLWVPITKDIRPMTSDQISAGVYWTGTEGWEFSLESWLKELDAVLDYQDIAAGSYGSAQWNTLVSMGRGEAFGGELFIRKTKGRTTGWASYTLSKSSRWFPDGSINEGKRYPFTLDHRHCASIFVNQRLGKRVDLSATWSFASGGAATIPIGVTGVYNYRGDISYVPLMGERGNWRMPSSHRLDLGVSISKQKKHGERTWNFSIYNVYAHKNPFVIEKDVAESWRYTETEAGWYARIRVKATSLLLCIPSFSYTFKF